MHKATIGAAILSGAATWQAAVPSAKLVQFAEALLDNDPTYCRRPLERWQDRGERVLSPQLRFTQAEQASPRQAAVRLASSNVERHVFDVT